MSWRMVVLIMLALWVAAIMHGGVYTIVAAHDRAYRLNRFTGNVAACYIFDCKLLPWRSQGAQ